MTAQARNPTHCREKPSNTIGLTQGRCPRYRKADEKGKYVTTILIHWFLVECRTAAVRRSGNRIFTTDYLSMGPRLRRVSFGPAL